MTNLLTQIGSKNCLFKLDHLGMIYVSGPDAKRFLQGLLTCDMEKVTPFQSTLGAACDLKGRMIINFDIWQWKDGYTLLLPKTLSNSAIAHLKKYALFSKVSIEVNESIVLECCGPTIEEILHPINTSEQLLIIRRSLSLPRFLIIGQPPPLSMDIMDIEYWKALNIESGLATITQATSHQLLPQMINLQHLGGVSFSKGCYMGQEIVARTEHLGKLKRLLYKGSIATTAIPALGSALTQNAENVGVIVESARIQNNCLILAVVYSKAFDNPSALQWNRSRVTLTLAQSNALSF